MAIQAVGKQIEAFELLCGKTSERPEWSNWEVTIDAAQRRGKPRCFNCWEEGHLAKDCKKPKNQCPKCKFLGGGHSWNCRDNRTAHTTETMDGQKEKDPFAAMRGMLWSHLRDYSFNGHLTDFVNFSLFILSYLIISDFELWGDSLQELTYLMPFTISSTHVCLMANLVLLNLTLSLTVHFHAVHGYAATHMCITHVLCFSSILPLPCGCIMLLISVMLALDSISRSDTNMYIQYDSI